MTTIPAPHAGPTGRGPRPTLAMVRLDWLTVRPYGRSFAVFLVVAAVCAVALDDPTYAVSIGTVYAALMVSYPFAVAEKNDLDTLYATLPLSGRGFLAGRYLFAVAAFVASTAVMSALSLVVAAVTGRSLDGAALTLLLAACTALYATVVAVQFPLYAWLGYTRARLVAYSPFFVFLPVVVVAQRLHVSWTPPGPGPALALAVGYAAVALVASAALAARLGPRRAVRRRP